MGSIPRMADGFNCLKKGERAQGADAPKIFYKLAIPELHYNIILKAIVWAGKGYGDMRWKYGMVVLVILIAVWALPVGAGAAPGDISAFVINGVHGVIDNTARMITVNLPYAFFGQTQFSPVIAFEGDSISPGNMVSTDFSSPPVQYTVTYAGVPTPYDVTVNIAPASSACDMLRFELEGQNVLNPGTSFTVNVPASTNVTSLTPNIVMSPSANIAASVPGPPYNFSSPVTFTVTAEDGSTNVYTVTVKKQSTQGGTNPGGQTTTGQTTTGQTDMSSLGTSGSLTGGAGGTITAPGSATPTAKPSRTVGPSTFQRKVELRGETDESRNHSFVITDALAEDAITRTHNSAYNQEKLNAEMEVLFVSDKENTRSLSITFEESALRRLYDARIENVSFITSLYCITLNQRAIYELMQQAAGEVTISLQPVDLAGRVALIGERPAYMLWLICGNGFAPQLSRGEITLDIAYTPNEEEDAHMLCAVDATDESNPFWVPNSYYSGGKVHLTVNKGGIIGVGASNARQFTTSFWPN